MIRDPFYQQICKGLSEQLDPALFQKCAADLLRSDFPSLVPLGPGSDAGMDAAIADGEGEPFPLVCTTRKDVIGNLTASLKSYLKNDGKRRKVVVVTSRCLSNRKRQNLEKRAKEYGFTLVQTYTQDAMATRLYSNQRWCRELLGLSGTPPALSVFPRTRRPLIGNALIGREGDLTWIRQGNGDRLLVGQPGSGKTFLLHALAREGHGLFVNSNDRTEIAAAIRSQKPQIIILDDAHTQIELLTDLCQLRTEMQVDFSILAIAWPGRTDVIEETLQLTNQVIHKLEPLTRDQIVEVVKNLGLTEPTELIREIVNQAEGLPGLAITLTQACLHEEILDVIRGNKLSRSLRASFGKETMVVLAAFAIGGDAGIKMCVVAGCLGIPLIRVHTVVTELAAGGVIHVLPETFSVHTKRLRHSLVRDVFFSGPESLDYSCLMANAPKRVDVARTLIGARAVGGVIRDDLLHNILEQASSVDAWCDYASLGAAEATHLLNEHPEMLTSATQQLIHYIPEITIPRLLETAVDDHRPLHSNPDHPLRRISSWVEYLDEPNKNCVIEKRRILLEALSSWLSSGGNSKIGFHALTFVFSPQLERTTLDPGLGETFSINWGSFSLAGIEALEHLWPEALEILKKAEITDWTHLFSMVEHWVHPMRPDAAGKMSPEIRNKMRAFGQRMLRDFYRLGDNHPAVLHRVREIARTIDMELEAHLDPDFENLYARINFKNSWQTEERKRSKIIKGIASRWAKQDAQKVATRMHRFEQEAKLANLTSPRLLPYLSHEIAAQTSTPGIWARALLATNCAGDLVEPFLRKSASLAEEGWEDLVRECLENEAQRFAALSVILTHPTPPSELLNQVLSSLDGYLELLETCCIRKQIPETTLNHLLAHENSVIASVVAIKVSHANKKTIPLNIQTNWHAAVIRSSDDFSLSQVLKRDPSLAVEWLEAHLQRNPTDLWRFTETVKSAVSLLNVDEHLHILSLVPEDFGVEELVQRLVGDDLEIYRSFLADGQRTKLHLLPLRGNIDELWVKKALLALGAGYTPDKIADAVYGYGSRLSWVGRESDRWERWMKSFEPLCSHGNKGIQQVGKIGQSRAMERRRHALQRERQKAVYGWR